MSKRLDDAIQNGLEQTPMRGRWAMIAEQVEPTRERAEQVQDELKRAHRGEGGIMVQLHRRADYARVNGQLQHVVNYYVRTYRRGM